MVACESQRMHSIRLVGLAALLGTSVSCSREPAPSQGDHSTLGPAVDRAPEQGRVEGCEELPSAMELERYLKIVPGEREAGGLASGKA